MSHQSFVELHGEASMLLEECPLTVRERQISWRQPTDGISLVERKQIPHLRVMGRNIRFLKSDLETFRASFKRFGDGECLEHASSDGVVYQRLAPAIGGSLSGSQGMPEEVKPDADGRKEQKEVRERLRRETTIYLKRTKGRDLGFGQC